MVQWGKDRVVSLAGAMHLLRIQHHRLTLVLVLVDAHRCLESHLDLTIVYLLLVLLSRGDFVHVKCNVVFLMIALLLVMQLFKLGLLVVMDPENWMALGTFLIMLHSLDGHHTSSTSPIQIGRWLSKRS